MILGSWILSKGHFPAQDGFVGVQSTEGSNRNEFILIFSQRAEKQNRLGLEDIIFFFLGAKKNLST